MQTGSVTRHGRGWRGHYREGDADDRDVRDERRSAARVERAAAPPRTRLRYRKPIMRTLDRFCAVVAAPQAVKYARETARASVSGHRRCSRAGEITLEAISGVLVAVEGDAWRHDILRTLRMVFRFGVRNKLVDENPAREVSVPKPIRGERIMPLSIDEVDKVASECSWWAPLVLFMADSGARPAEALGLEWRSVDLDAGTVELASPRKVRGKTTLAWRTVFLTSRGTAALRAVPRSITTRKVFHVAGREVGWTYFRREVWGPALEAAGLSIECPCLEAHVCAAQPRGWRPHRDTRPPNGPRERLADVHGLRRLGQGNGRQAAAFCEKKIAERANTAPQTGGSES